jgi:hypothetical protein
VSEPELQDGYRDRLATEDDLEAVTGLVAA